VLAREDAWHVGGVSAVENQLLVDTSGEAIADEDIVVDCVIALGNERLVPHGSVSVVVINGWVTLNGGPPPFQRREPRGHAVRRVDGVVGLTECITLPSQPIRSDVVNQINRAFERNAIIDHFRIEVTSAGHTLYLNGTVPDRFAMDEAVGTANLAPGVREVVSRLVVTPKAGGA
jgi:osmotically-inducible protein OsmY